MFKLILITGEARIVPNIFFLGVQGSDQSFVDKLNMKFDRDPNFIKSRQTNDGTFTIAHYAGRVTYTAYEWLEKNRDTMPPGATQMLQTAENKLLSLIFKGTYLVHRQLLVPLYRP